MLKNNNYNDDFICDLVIYKLVSMSVYMNVLGRILLELFIPNNLKLDIVLIHQNQTHYLEECIEQWYIIKSLTILEY